MADLPSVTNLINSPPSQLVAGAALAGIVWKFFERVEAVLTDQTKLEIAVWLLDRERISPTFRSWPDTFAKVFDRVFGDKHFSWRCFSRSAVASLICGAIGLVLTVRTFLVEEYVDEANVSWYHSVITDYEVPFLPKSLAPDPNDALRMSPVQDSIIVLLLCTVGIILVTNILPDYVSLLETRFVLKLMRGSTLLPTLLLLVVDVVFTGGTAAAWNALLLLPRQGKAFTDFLEMDVAWLVYPAFFTSIWLWLYAGSGFLLKAARHFDLGFAWFNRKFDIEKHPLNAIGLVAGSLVAILYWGWAVFRHFVPA
jgi:hypothetical protein